VCGAAYDRRECDGATRTGGDQDMRNDDPRAVERIEDLRFLRGKGTFVDDIGEVDLLHAVFVRSQIAHGVLRGIATADARAMAGVAFVLTAADFGDTIPALPLRLAPIAGVERFLQPPIARDKVRYVGEVVAIVLASSRAIGEDAADLVVVDVEPLAAVIDARDGERDLCLLHPEEGTNVATRYTVGKGDAAAQFASAHYVRRQFFRSHRQTATPLETRGLIARWSGDGLLLQIKGAAKVPHTTRKVLSVMLDVPVASIEMIEVDIGGGFGVRGELHPEDYLVPAAARVAGRPVKWIEDRREHLMSANHSREIDADLEIACAKDGKILAMRGRLWGNMGAWIRPNGGVVPAKAAQFLLGPYDVLHASLDVAFVMTNKTPVGTYRGPGRFEAGFFRERLIDIAAGELGIDPADMRRRNLIGREQMPYTLGKLVPYEGEAVYDSGDFPAAFERAALEIGYDRLKVRSGLQADGRYHGVAVTACVESSGPGPREHARMRLAASGKIEIFVGSSSMGQGLETIFSQIAGDQLGLPLDQFEVHHGSTTHLAEGLGTYASRAVIMGGSAVLDAAKKFKAAMDGFVRDLGLQDIGLPISDVIALFVDANAISDDVTIDVDGLFENTKLTYTPGAHAAYVAVDPATGHVEVIDYVAVEDVGRAINPALVHGQAIGGVVQGLGGAFLDHLVYDEEGQLLTASFADYLLPTASDFPNVRAVTLEDCPSLTNPLGAKGAGEGPIVMVGATIGNAIAAALRPLGVAINEMPFSPARVYGAIAGRHAGWVRPAGGS
jgi:aerobic carbon-monoxide dehydrogenase large subunit